MAAETRGRSSRLSPGERARIVDLDKRRVWHPYTEMGTYRREVDPLVVVAARGARLHDADGRSYLDGNSSWWTAVLGHGHPRLLEALRRQSEVLCHTALGGVTHGPAAELAEALASAAPRGLDHVFYSDDGSTAVEVAMQMALQYWWQNGRPERCHFAALEDGFHGETLGATALGGVDVFRQPFAAVLPRTFCVPPPREPAGRDASFRALTELMEQHGPTLAALVLEPVLQGAAGMRLYDPAYLRHARELCDRHGVLLVFDEVASGYGRTGPMWAAEHAGVVPDLLCTAKGMSGGMLPMAATLANDRVFDGFQGDPERAFLYGHTFCGNPLGAAVALEVLRIFDDEQVLDRAKPKAERIARAFAELGSLPGVAATRALGMVGALDLEGEAGYLADAGWRVYSEALGRGAYLRPLGNVVYVAPPLNIPDSDLEELLQILAESVEAAVGSRA